MLPEKTHQLQAKEYTEQINRFSGEYYDMCDLIDAVLADSMVSDTGDT